jgi:hypothetical protein
MFYVGFQLLSLLYSMVQMYHTVQYKSRFINWLCSHVFSSVYLLVVGYCSLHKFTESPWWLRSVIPPRVGERMGIEHKYNHHCRAWEWGTSFRYQISAQCYLHSESLKSEAMVVDCNLQNSLFCWATRGAVTVVFFVFSFPWHLLIGNKTSEFLGYHSCVTRYYPTISRPWWF